MFNNYWVVSEMDNEQVDEFMAKANKYHLVCLHKIGIYGTLKVNEVYVKGNYFQYRKLLNEFNKTRKVKK